MKTNIRVKKKCEYCKEEFVAKTTKTRYCCHRCNQKGYKLNLKTNKIATTEKARAFRFKLQQIVSFLAMTTERNSKPIQTGS